MALNARINNQLNDLFEKIKKSEKSGIGFNLNVNENPLSIFGVLDFLKYKIKKWSNTNIFVYQGRLLDKSMILVIGSNNLEEAKEIVLFIFLNELINKKHIPIKIMENLNSIVNIEDFLNLEILNNLTIGFPNDKSLEKKIRKHLEALIDG